LWSSGADAVSVPDEVRDIQKIKIWQFPKDKACAKNFKRWAETTYKLEAEISSRMDVVTRDSDIVITSTPSRSLLVNSVFLGLTSMLSARRSRQTGNQSEDIKTSKNSG